MFWVLMCRSTGKCHIVRVCVTMPRKAVLPLRPLWTVTGTVCAPRRTVRCTTARGAEAHDGLMDVVGGGDGMPVDGGDDVAVLEVVVGRAAALDVDDEGLIAGQGDRVAESAQRHLLRRVLGVDHQQRVEAGVGRVARAAEHVLLLHDGVAAVEAGEDVGVQVRVAGRDLDGEEEEAARGAGRCAPR